MTRQVLFRVLLSLLLLVSQHMATTHVLSHWSSAAERGAQARATSPGDAPSTLSLDQSCHKCLAFAQLAGPLPAPIFAFPLPAIRSVPVFGADVAAAHTRLVLAFQSRGPPHA